MDEHMYQVTVEDLTVPSSIFATVTPGMSVSGAIVELGQRKTAGETVEWEKLRSIYDEVERPQVRYPGWKRDRVVLILCVLIAGFLIGLGVGKRTHEAPAPAPAPTPATTALSATYGERTG
jgi:hypothetical protein